MCWRADCEVLIHDSEASARQHHVLISNKSRVKKNYFDSNVIRKGNVTLLKRFVKDYFAADVDRSECLHATSSSALFCKHYVGNVIYHKFSHSDVFYRFNWKIVNVMLEYVLALLCYEPNQCTGQ